jgi:hypothetical protein
VIAQRWAKHGRRDDLIGATEVRLRTEPESESLFFVRWIVRQVISGTKLSFQP